MGILKMATIINVDENRLELDVRAMALNGFTVATIGSFNVQEYLIQQSLQNRKELKFFTESKCFKEMGSVDRLLYAADIRQALDLLHEQGYITPALNRVNPTRRK
jgi:hypothetical protein